MVQYHTIDISTDFALKYGRL